MNNQQMTNEEFDALWQRARTEGRARRMTADYVAWRRRQRRNTATVASIAIVAVAVALPLTLGSHSRDYDRVYCNRTGTSDAQWVDMATTMLDEMLI